MTTTDANVLSGRSLGWLRYLHRKAASLKVTVGKSTPSTSG